MSSMFEGKEKLLNEFKQHFEFAKLRRKVDAGSFWSFLMSEWMQEDRKNICWRTEKRYAGGQEDDI